MNATFKDIINEIPNLKSAHLSDGPHWTPDGGSFWAKDGKYYWPDGHVTNSPPCRLWDGNIYDVENYSEWSDEKRADVWAETEKKRKQIKKEQIEYQEAQEKLIESARSKLTEDEFDAVFDSGGRGDY